MEVHVDWQGLSNNIQNYCWFPKLKKEELIVIVMLLQQSIIINVNYISTKMKEKYMAVQTCELIRNYCCWIYLRWSESLL